MTRGKYAARAANRLAEIDAGLVAELTEKLAAVTAERDTARSEAENLRRKTASEAARIGRETAAAHVKELKEELDQEQHLRRQDRRFFLASVVSILQADGTELSTKAWIDLGRLFQATREELATYMKLLGRGDAPRQFDFPRGVRREQEHIIRRLNKVSAKGKDEVWDSWLKTGPS